MAEKEATIYIVDLASSMGKKNQGRQLTDLEWALQYIWDKITNTVLSARKTAQIGIIGLGTDATENGMGKDEGYTHISVLQSISQVLMPQLQRLPELLRISRTDDRDVLSSIIIAVDMIIKHCRQLQYKRKIVVVTNATGQIDDDDIASTSEQIKKNKIELVVLGIDFDDHEYGFKEEDKPPTKVKNERILRDLVNASGGMIGTMQEAIDGLSRPQIKQVRPTPTYSGQLRLGDPQGYDTALTIDVQRYFKTSVRKPPTASSYAIRQDPQSQSNNPSIIHSISHYWVENGQEKLDVPREDLAKGYEYGRTAVHISQTDENITKLETEAAYDIVGFVPAENVERYILLDNSNMLIAQKANDKASLALSSLIHALFELDSVAICRFVKKDMSEPTLTLLSPLIEEDHECLIENVLPFSEDIRNYRFAPLDKVATVSGNTLSQHRNLPNEDLLKSMNDFVDQMSLSQNEQYLTIDEIFSPALHVIEDAIKFRAVHPKESIPDKTEAIGTYSKVPEEVRLRSQKALIKLIDSAEIKKVPPRVKGRKRFRDTEKPLSGLNIEELFRKEKRVRISPVNAIPEFKQRLSIVEDIADVKDAVRQMSSIIEEQTTQSYGDLNYDRIIEELSVVREEMLDLEEPSLYNEMIRQLKSKILAKELGGERRELWWKIRSSRIGLIDNVQCTISEVSREEALAFQ